MQRKKFKSYHVMLTKCNILL